MALSIGHSFQMENEVVFSVYNFTKAFYDSQSIKMRLAFKTQTLPKSVGLVQSVLKTLILSRFNNIVMSLN